ncbi:hypothetical protein EDC01DRAFT_660650 [Geopyxis carbonaria]|nr:hypothetical protein EDC01DRAFT_660650 [Geopyxis carbonaria]
MYVSTCTQPIKAIFFACIIYMIYERCDELSLKHAIFSAFFLLLLRTIFSPYLLCKL